LNPSFLLQHYQRQIVADLVLSNMPGDIITHRFHDKRIAGILDPTIAYLKKVSSETVWRNAATDSQTPGTPCLPFLPRPA
jgi:hypothetical protein